VQGKEYRGTMQERGEGTLKRDQWGLTTNRSLQQGICSEGHREGLLDK